MPASGPVVLTERDLEVLRLVGAVGYIATEQIARELFPNLDRARRRLRQLFDGRYIRVAVTDTRTQNLVSLTPAGRDALEVTHGGPVDGLVLCGAISLSSVWHHLAIVDVRLAMAAMKSAGIGELLEWNGGRSQRSINAGFAAAKIAPDGIADIQLGATTGVVAVEVDCATEGTRFLKSKLDHYARTLPTLAKTELWVLALGEPRRLDHVRRLCDESGIARKTRLFSHADVLRRPFRLVPRLATTIPAASRY